MKTVLLAVTAGFIGSAVMSWLKGHLVIERVNIRDLMAFESIEQDETDIEGDHSPQCLHGLTEHEEAAEIDKYPDALPVTMKQIHFGDLSIACPNCDVQNDELCVGIGTAEDRESGEGEFNDLISVGIILLPCGCHAMSRHIVEKVAKILDAEERGELDPSLFDLNALLSPDGYNGWD